MNIIKKSNNLSKFNKNLSKLQKNIRLNDLKSLFLSDYEVIAFVNFNFYNSVNVSIFKDILEKHNIKYTYIKSNDYKFYNKSNSLFNFWNSLDFSKGDLTLLNNLFFKNNNINNKNINKDLYFKNIFSKNFNIILFLNYNDINNNILETLKVYSKVDPIYLKFKSHNKLISYNYLVNNLIKKEKSLKNFKFLFCKYVLLNNIKVLKMFNYLKEKSN